MIYHTAIWHFRREQNVDGKAITTLEIELGNDYAITLTAREGEQNSVSIWAGSGEHDFVEDPEGFAEWLEDITVMPCSPSSPNRVLIDAVAALDQLVKPTILRMIDRSE